MYKKMLGINYRFQLILLILWVSLPCFAQANKENIALGSTVSFNWAPNYLYSTDDDDILQLTDGVYATGWVDKAMVGWVRDLPISITIDLGKVQPIGGVSFSTAAGSGGVQWPAAIQMFCSDDAKNWYSLGNLVKMSPSPPKNGRHAFRYTTDELSASGRYLRLTVTVAGVFLFCDEIEVYRGDAKMINQNRGEILTAAMIEQLTLNVAFQRRIEIDRVAADNAIRSSTLPAKQQEQLLARLDDDFAEAVKADPDPKTFKAILPYNDAHARILGVNSIPMQHRVLPKFFAWKKHRFDPLTMNETPLKLTKPKISIEMLKNEVRADALLLTNTTDKPINARIVLRKMNGGQHPNWLSISSLPWVDGTRFIPIAAALPEAPFTDGYQIDIPAGITRKVWFTVDSSKLSPGKDSGEITVVSDTATLRIHFVVRVSKVVMDTPRLSLAMWDYTDRDNFMGITLANRDAAIALMRSHGVDSPWATRTVLPWPNEAAFTPANTLQTPLTFEQFDAWVKRWPGACQYTVFCNVGDTFAGAKMGTAEFNARVSAWANALSQHMKELGIPSQKLWLSLVDEPQTEEKNARITAWAKAISNGTPELTIFVNPIWKKPELVEDQSMFDAADVLSPNILQLLTGTAESMNFYQKRQLAGQTLWFFTSGGSVRQYDPHRYYRLMAWYAFRYNAAGIAFWAFGDNGNSKNSWVEYLNDRYSFSPVFLDSTSATDSIHWQAVREGIEDYEILSMLREATARTTNTKLRQQAMNLFADIDAVLGDKVSQMELTWLNTDDRTQPDVIRQKAISLLEKMR